MYKFSFTNYFKVAATLALLLFGAYGTSVFALTCPDYTFTRDLKQGDRGEDVRLIQKILNADYRTQIAPNLSIGGPGQETLVFGIATRESVKRFQALFIEAIGIANGRFGPKTRTVMNSVCQGPYFRGGGGSVYDGVAATTTTTTTPVVASTTDKVGPAVFLSASTSVLAIDGTLRITLSANEAIKAPVVNNFFLTAGKAGFSDLRKVNPNAYTVLLTPLEDEGGVIKFQIEADTVSDMSGNKNTNASNELILTINNPLKPVNGDYFYVQFTADSRNTRVCLAGNGTGVAVKEFVNSASSTVGIATTSATGTGIIMQATDSRKIVPVYLVESAPCVKINVTGTTVPIATSTIPDLPTLATTTTTTDPGIGGGSDSGSQFSIQDILMLLVAGKSLFGNLFGGGTGGTTGGTGGGTQFGGTATVEAPCGCMPGRSTILFAPIGGGGLPGYYFKELNPSVMTGCYVVGTPIMTPASPGNICGARIRGNPKKDPCADVPGGIHTATCCGTNMNTARQLVIGSFPPPPVVRGCGL